MTFKDQTDKPALMSREEIESLNRRGISTVREQAELVDTALSAHDIYAQAYDKAIEDAAQVCEVQGYSSERMPLIELAGHIRQLKGTSNA